MSDPFSGHMLRGVIFDMDGVLVDSHPVHKWAWRTLLASNGRYVADNELSIIEDGLKREEILKHFFYDVPHEDRERLGRQKNDLFRQAVKDMKTIEGLFPFLNELEIAGIPKAVATSASSARAHETLQTLGLLSHFGAVVTGSDVEKGKPDPTLFRLAAQQLAIDAANLLVIEDSVSGVRAAKSCGMRCLGIGSEHRANLLLNHGADMVIPNYVSVSLTIIDKIFDVSGVA